MAQAAKSSGSEQRLAGGSFYGSVAGRQAVGGSHLHRVASRGGAQAAPTFTRTALFLPVFWRRLRGEIWPPRSAIQPFTFSFRPAGVPHQDQVGPKGARMFAGNAACRAAPATSESPTTLRAGNYCGSDSSFIRRRAPRLTLVICKSKAWCRNYSAVWPASPSAAPQLRSGRGGSEKSYAPNSANGSRWTTWLARRACIPCTFHECFGALPKRGSASMCTGYASVKPASAC
jgi:hypothetical protein